MKKVAFSYGWAEGKLHSKSLGKSLVKAGFNVTDNLVDCDVIVAHSGGVFLIPKTTKAKLVLLVGVPYWPERSPLESLVLKIALEIKSPKPILTRTIKNFYNLLYIFDAPHQLKIQKMFYKHGYPKLNCKVISVQYRQDPFMEPNKTKDLAKNMGWSTAVLDGQHDDIWLKHEPFISLLQKSVD